MLKLGHYPQAGIGVGAINLQGATARTDVGARTAALDQLGFRSSRASAAGLHVPARTEPPLAPPVTSAIWPVRSRAVLLLHRRGVEVLDQTKQTVRCHWQLEDLAAERRQCVGERICDRRPRADRAALAHAAEPA
jgi:hypothetical protein